MRASPEERRRSGTVPAADEARRRRREAVLMVVTAVAFAVFAVFETRLPDFGNKSSRAGHVIFFLLINLNVILLVLLVFLVTRNFVKLLVERRRGILGSRLRIRLVLAFVSVALFPTVLLVLVAQGFVGAAIDSWFEARIENALEGATRVVHRYYLEAGSTALHHAERVAHEVEERGLLGGRHPAAEIARFASAKRADLGLDGLQILHGREPAAVTRKDGVWQSLAPLSPADLDGLLQRGESFTRTQRSKPGDVVRAGAPLRDQSGKVVGAVVVEHAVPSLVTEPSRRTARSYEQYRQLKVLKRPVEGGYTLTFFLITLVVLLSGSWFGFYFAKGITGPIQKLGEGMREVARGNWSYRAERVGDDEIATLFTSFNQMTAELETIHSALEERRRYIENLLANVTAGVVSVDQAGAIATVNPAAGAMLDVRSAEVRGLPWREVFARPDLEPIASLLEGTMEGRRARMERQVRLLGEGRAITAWVTATTLTDETGVPKGGMLFLEDVTHLLRVERMEAWREVARRIAHEIKNPLTPIQLSAQRLRKRFAGRLGASEDELFDECTRTIVGQVEQLKRLVDEFSTFARLPSVDVAPRDLNEVVDETLVLFREGHRDVAFTFRPDPGLPRVDIDADAIKRMMINLLDNAVSACREAGDAASVEVSTTYEPELGLARLEVADNGAGMSPAVKARAFEPYFSTKRDGTGLGLAIVSSIVSDHHAYLRIRDNEPRGTRLVVEFPLRGAARRESAARA